MGYKTPNGEAAGFLRDALGSRTRECIVWPYANSTGYASVWWNGRTTYAHIVACVERNGPRPPGMEASHTCGNALCVNPRHLVWEPPKPNHARRVAHGTSPRGERNVRHKLTEEDVHMIRRRVAAGDKQTVIARELGVLPATVNHVVKGRNWWWL